MKIGWTTVETRPQAEQLAQGLIDQRLAVCVQIEGPITSVYRWDQQTTSSPEYRLMVKFLSARETALEAWILSHHPYDTPEWIVVSATHVAEKYLSWARASSTSSPL